MADLRLTSDDVASVDKLQMQSLNGRDSLSVSLIHESVGETQILINGPAGFLTSGESYPLFFVSAGFFAGKDAVALLENPGSAIVVGYEYPTTKTAVLKDPSLLAKTVRLAPAQIALALKWLQHQPWSKQGRLSVMGVSLGSLFMPVSLRIAENLGVKVNSVILAYGGVGIGEILNNLLREQISQPALGALCNLIDNLTLLHKPELHLPFLHGPFLAIYGTQDQIFSVQSSMKQFELLPEPKEMHMISGPHIDTDKPELIKESMMVTLDFLDRNGFFR